MAGLPMLRKDMGSGSALRLTGMTSGVLLLAELDHRHPLQAFQTLRAWLCSVTSCTRRIWAP
ncbi:MAG: hypothetical protein AAFW82_04595, partial [Pseudomonadota bacterium]